MPEPLNLGAHWDGHATTFCVWAPDHRLVAVVVDDTGRTRPLTASDTGYWSATFDDIGPGHRYRYRLDEDDARTFPDPASRFQPLGVHGPSEVIDPAAFAWTDAHWVAPVLPDLVFYELHVGTFTPQGTFRGVVEQLDHLASLGVTAIELMPLADFPGNRNWGYDGTALFAPARAYGRPDDLRALVDAAHGRGLAVFVDVVYNHLGPDGNYLRAFSTRYFNAAHTTPWGDAINLDRDGSHDVRRFLIENALRWIREYHADGLRLDATQALIDDGPEHFLSELTRTVRARAGRAVHLVAEDNRNLAQLVLPPERSGFGLDAVWADDFHHQIRVHTAHDREGYYAAYRGTTTDIATTMRQGWFFTGAAMSLPASAARGTPTIGIDPCRFVICLQNHDQIGNRADGARLHHQVDLATFRALTALMLLAPETPLLFMGQEWAATTPFLYFTDHHAELGALVTEGRRAEFSGFSAFHDPAQRAAIPDPQSLETFERSRLAWDEPERSPHREMLTLYRQLLTLRKQLAPGRLDTGAFDVSSLNEHAVALRLPSALVVARLSGAGSVDVERTAPAVLTTEDGAVAHDPSPIHIAGSRITFTRPGAVVMSTSLAPP
jgi:maltooligosyltrehalose trehalohydrolase